ncbi:MAG TPA: CBS domain-containing protein [Polyangiaceae bacterium]
MRKVRDIMEPNVFWLTGDAPLDRAAEMLAERQIGGAPVCDATGRIVGIFSKTDLAEHYGCANVGRVVRDVMTPEAICVKPDDPIERAVELMAFEGVHRLLVVEGDRLAGILTSMDVLRELAGFPRREHRVIAVAPPS